MIAVLERATMRGCRSQIVSEEWFRAFRLGKLLFSGLRISCRRNGAILGIEKCVA
jgi:hypothetical protein